MDVGGTAVGIASLGVQACQGLLSYYDDWKAYDADISNTYSAITDLSKTLTILRSTLQEEVDEEKAGRVRICVKSCEGALLELEKKRCSLQNFSQPKGLRQKMWAGLQRSWYPFRKETLEALKAIVTGIQERLKLALQVLQLDVGAKSQKLVLRLISQATAQHDSLAQITAQNQRVLHAQHSDEFRKIVTWLAPPDPGTNHDTARRRHESQTGEWLLKSKQYRSWKTGAVSHLWIYGKAGCGKTILCSTAIEDIQIASEQDADIAFAFFYFSFSDECKQSDRDMLLSLVAQLGWREPGLSMLRQAYGDAKRSVPGPDGLEKILLASTRSCSTVYLLMDALDECPQDHGTRQDVLARVERLTQEAPNLRILATSRELDRIRKSMETLIAEPLRVTTRAVDDDIRIFLASEMSRDRSLRELSPEMRVLIENTIASQADGMFRWAYCQLQELKNLDSYKPKYVKQVLQTLPPTLDDTYTRMLTRIKTMYHQEALTLLHWLAYARSPPTLSELVDAAIIDPDEESFIDVSERGGLRDALNILSGLVTVEEDQAADTKDQLCFGNVVDDTTANGDCQGASMFYSQHFTTNTRVRLAHFSVKEYLESERILNSSARQFYLQSVIGHRALSQSCLTYLRYYSSSPEKTSTQQDLKTFPLLEYTAQSWSYHCGLQGDGLTGREVTFLHTGQAKDDWLLVHDPDIPWENKPFSKYRPRLKAPGSAIYYASLLGLSVVVSSLLASGADVQAQDGRYGSAIQAAAREGHMETVQLLVKKGVNVNALGGLHGSAVQAAAEGGHKKIVQLLVNNGADVKAKGGRYGSAVQAAAVRGHAEIVQLLVDEGADVNVQDEYYVSAVQAAAQRGYTMIVQLLVNKGADANRKEGDYCSAIQAAAAGGHTETVQLLVNLGADVNTRGGRFGSALQAAAAGGYTETAKLLIDMGADVNVQDEHYVSAVQAALERGHTATVQLLIDKGADVDAQDERYGSVPPSCRSRRSDRNGVVAMVSQCSGILTSVKDKIFIES